MKRLFASYKTFDLVASTLVTVYNHASMVAGLYSRMIRCKYPDLRARIAVAQPKSGVISDRQKRAKQYWPQDQANKRPEEAASSSDARQDEQLSVVLALLQLAPRP